MKHYQVKRSILVNLLKSVLVVYLAGVLLLTTLYIVQVYQHTKNDITNELKVIANTFKSDLKLALSTPDNQRLSEIGNKILALPVVVSVLIVDANGNSLYAQGKDVGSSGTQLFSRTLGITRQFAGNTIRLATVSLYSDSGVILNRLKFGFALIFLFGVIKTFFLASLLIWAVKKLCIRPLNKLTKDIELINLDNLSKSRIDLHIQDDNEWKAIEATSNQMLRKLDLAKEEWLKIENNYQRILEKEVSERTHELELSNKQLNTLAATDPLTHIRNRRSFFDIAEKYYSIAVRTKEQLSVMMIDIDYFKSVNDKYGHAVGDEVLKEFANVTKRQLRDSDLFARYGGEEFVIVLPNTGIEGAEKLADKIRHTIASHYLVTEKGEIQITISIGVSALSGHDTSLDDILSRADKALYRAKENGRNRIEKMAA